MLSPTSSEESRPFLRKNEGRTGFSRARPRKPLPGPMDISKTRRAGILTGLWVATFLQALNTTLVATLVSSISSEFQRSNEASWLGTSFLLATCTFTPLYGRLCNVAGRRLACLTAITFCGLGTVACGLSGSLPMLIAARFLAGIGGGGILTTSSICTSDMFSMRDRSITQGIASIFLGAGMGLGGPLGGFIADRYGWRWAFLCQAPLFITAFGFVMLSLNYTTPGQGKSVKEVIKRIDFMGSGALFVTVGSCLFFLSFKYNQDREWNDWLVITAIILAVIFAGIFIWVELFVAVEPVLSPALLKQKVPVLVGLSNLVVATCNFSVQYHFPLWFEAVAGTSATVAGLHLMPNSVAMSTGSLFAGFMMHRTGKYKSLTVIFGILPAIATLLISRLKPNSHPIVQWISIIPLGFGNAVVLQTTLIALLASIPQSAIAVGTGFTILFRGIGQVSGVAVASALFQSLLDRHLHEGISGPGSDELIKKIRHSFKVVEDLPLEQRLAARIAYEKSLRMVFRFAAAATFTGFLIRLFIPELSLDRPQDPAKTPIITHANESDSSSDLDDEIRRSDDGDDTDDDLPLAARPKARRLSTYESFDAEIASPRQAADKSLR